MKVGALSPLSQNHTEALADSVQLIIIIRRILPSQQQGITSKMHYNSAAVDKSRTELLDDDESAVGPANHPVSI
jgi:hypothetical protein